MMKGFAPARSSASTTVFVISAMLATPRLPTPTAILFPATSASTGASLALSSPGISPIFSRANFCLILTKRGSGIGGKLLKSKDCIDTHLPCHFSDSLNLLIYVDQHLHHRAADVGIYI